MHPTPSHNSPPHPHTTHPHTLTPLTPHTNCILTTHTTHIPPGKVVSDNKERVQLTGCKASILSLQFDYQVSDTRTHTHIQAL